MWICEHAVDLSDGSNAADGMHLGGAANQRLAEHLVPAVLDIVHVGQAESRMTGSLGLELRRFAVIVIVLGTIATLAPAPWYATDRDTYETVGRQFVLPDCSELHCFRVLVAWTLESLPGPSLVKWKAFAVLANAAAAIALGRLCLVLGLSARGRPVYATWLAAFGFGSSIRCSTATRLIR